jgi:hypothetical protein
MAAGPAALPAVLLAVLDRVAQVAEWVSAA